MDTERSRSHGKDKTSNVKGREGIFPTYQESWRYGGVEVRGFTFLGGDGTNITEVPSLLQRHDIAPRIYGNVTVESVHFGQGENRKPYVTVTGEDKKRYIFPKEHSRKETAEVGEAVLLVPKEILAKYDWLPNPETGYLPFERKGPRSFESFSRFVAEHGMFGDRNYVDPIPPTNPKTGEPQEPYPGDNNFLQIIPVGVQRNGLGEAFTVVRKGEKDSMNFRGALAGLTIVASYLGHTNDKDARAQATSLLLEGARREAGEEMVEKVVRRRLWRKSTVISTGPYMPFEAGHEYIPRGLVFTPNRSEKLSDTGTTAGSDVSDVHLGLILESRFSQNNMWQHMKERHQVGIGEKEENKLGVYINERQYKRWVKGFDLSQSRDKKMLERWMKRWKRKGYIAEDTRLSDLPAQIIAADWNPVLLHAR